MKNQTYNYLKDLHEDRLTQITNLFYDDTHQQITVFYIEFDFSQETTEITLPINDITEDIPYILRYTFGIYTDEELDELDRIYEAKNREDNTFCDIPTWN